MRWRQLALAAQGLGARRQFGQGLAGTLAAIEHLGYVQIDTLSVVARAHHHVLWSRVPGYAPQHLNQLSSAGNIFEYWFHAAAYLPMRDYRFALPRMLSFRRGESPYFKNVDPALMAEILARVRGEGTLKTRDLKDSTSGQGAWWDRGPGRRALDKLFMQGDLMILERKGMEKRYALPEQVLPPEVNQQEPTVDDMAAYLLDNAMRAHGVFTFGQLLHLRTGKPLRKAMRELLQARLAQGAVHKLDDPAHPDTYAVAAQPRAERLSPEGAEVRLLSPFDNAVIHRERLAQLFHFEYRLESYVPAAQRQYGYFCLPILWQGQFVGRMDCKADRRAARFHVHSQHLESGWVPDAAFHQGMQNAMNELARFCGCTQVQCQSGG
jgi:hypothetical protein